MEKVAKMGHTLGDQRRGNPKTINGPTRMRMHAKIQVRSNLCPVCRGSGARSPYERAKS